jgi:DNA-binding response OmpR family regulator
MLLQSAFRRPVIEAGGKPPHESNRKGWSVKTILLVDDDDSLRAMLRRLLTGLGYAVQEANDGEEAMLSCKRQQPDLVITDLVMPDAEGLAFIKTLRRMSTEVKIIAMSGGVNGSMGNYLFIAQSLGADYTFEKPFETQEMLSVIRRLLDPNQTPPTPLA